MGLEGKTAEQFVDTLKKLSKLTIEKEAELVEINPLAIMQDGTIMALDGKFVTDDNSNFRHPELQKYQEKTAIEEQAEKKWIFFSRVGWRYCSSWKRCRTCDVYTRYAIRQRWKTSMFLGCRWRCNYRISIRSIDFD